MKLRYSRILSVLLISLSVLYNSCSLVGLGVGSAVDGLKPDREIINPDEYKKIKQWEEIIIHLKDNSLKKGSFRLAVTGGEIPDLDNSIFLETEFGLERVKMDEILSMEIIFEGSAKKDGFVVGLIIDILLFISLANSDFCLVCG